MLKVTNAGRTITIETASGSITWDAGRGGQISRFVVKDDLTTHMLSGPAETLVDLRLRINGQLVRLSDVVAELTVTQPAADFARLTATARLANGAVAVTQEYEIHEEGALFCNLGLATPAGQAFDLAEASLSARVATDRARLSRWGYFTREPKYKRDYSTVHAFVGFSMFRHLTDTVDVRELLPFVSLDLGWETTRFYSNRLEFLVEDWTAYDNGPVTETRTRTGHRPDAWEADWFFLDGRTVRINGPYRYRNRWGLTFGRAKSQRGAGADPALRNNALGNRICHCMYPYARGGDNWPWVSMPLKQIDEQPPQTFRGNPDLTRVDEAAAAGADTMIIHQFWMRNPGSNNEPCADYEPFDPVWLKAFVDRCHQRQMRVALYVRGTEMYFQYRPFFEDFCRQGIDGLYADWHTPFCMGYVKSSPLHISAHNYFHFSKSIRRRVGAGGVLIGHTSNATLLTGTSFDAALGGEVSVRHDELLTNPENAVYFAGLDCMGGHLISGNLPDRVAFSGPRAAALCAALGMASHPFMEPDVPFADRVAFIKPLWDALRSLPGQITRLHNPAYIATRAVHTEAAHLYPSLWQSDTGQALLLITNMADQPESGTVELNLGELDLRRRKIGGVLPIAGAFTGVEVAGQTVRLKNIPALQFAAIPIE